MNGIILINKEKGCTSHDVVYKVKKLTNSKVGHTGTLDPNATGVLPLLIGEATKISKYLINHDKEYEVVLELGKKTSTADVEGEVIEEKEVPAKSLGEQYVKEIFKTFIGKQEQTPPIYSAIKINGKKLYEYARKGQEVKLEPRQIEIYDIELLNINKTEKQISFRVQCSKGTYIRSLCEDIAEKLGTVGLMKELKRTVVGDFKIENAITVEELKEKNLLKESEGAMIVDLDEYDMAPCLVMKKDGSSIYATRDLAAIFYRKKEYNFDKCIYVTGLEQKLHFAQVFKVVELMGYEWAKENLIHVPYGLVSLEGGKLSTRSGNIVYAEDILKESVSKIREIIAEKNPDLKDKEDVAQKVGIGAIIFNDLYNQRIKDVTFTWEKIHSFDGETGPYVQYTYARAASVLRKTGITEVGEIDPSLVTDETSVALLKEIERFPEVIKVAADRLEPSVISRYVMGVAQSFNRFYHENQCNVEDQKLKEARVKIVILAKQVIKDGLDLLGIQCPEQM